MFGPSLPNLITASPENDDAPLPPGFILAFSAMNNKANLNQGLPVDESLLPSNFFQTDVEKEIMNKLMFYDENKTPPNLEEAFLHAECCKVGQPITEMNVSKIKICPCCYNIENLEYPLCTSTKDITSLGPVIPMFFNLYKFLMLLTLFYCIGTFFSEWNILRGNCNLNLKNCDYNLRKFIDIEKRERTYIQVSIVPVLLGITLVSFLLLYYFQSHLRERVDAKSLSPSDYTAMLYEIGPDEENRAYIENYIYELLFYHDFPPVQIKSICIGKFEGNLSRIQADIDSIKLTIEALNKAATIPSITESAEKKIKKKLEAQEKKLKSFEEKYTNYSKRLENEPSLKYNSIAFVSFNTQAQADCVFQLETQKMKFRFYLSKIFPCFVKKKVHYIQQSPEPEDIKWKFIGYTSTQRFLSILYSYLVTLLLVLVSFGIQVGLRFLQYQLIRGSGDDMKGKSTFYSVWVQCVQWVSSVLVAVMNGLIITLSLKLSRSERHLSHSMFTLSHTKKLIFLQFINSAGVPIGLMFLP